MPEKKAPLRPKFLAPKPPLPPADTKVVANTPAPTGPKVVTKTKAFAPASPLTEVLKETDLSAVASAKVEPLPPLPPPPEVPMDSGAGVNLPLIGITVFSLVLAVAGWIMYFSAKGGLSLPSLSQPSPTPATSITPTVAPTPNLRQTTTLEVLNGSGVAGAAGKTATALEKLGYTITKTGNADNQKYTQTEIYISSSYQLTSQLINDLASFGSATTAGELKNSTASARIIVGKNWNQ